jgi:hypothetical protein
MAEGSASVLMDEVEVEVRNQLLCKTSEFQIQQALEDLKRNYLVRHKRKELVSLFRLFIENMSPNSEEELELRRFIDDLSLSPSKHPYFSLDTRKKMGEYIERLLNKFFSPESPESIEDFLSRLKITPDKDIAVKIIFQRITRGSTLNPFVWKSFIGLGCFSYTVYQSLCRIVFLGVPNDDVFWSGDDMWAPLNKFIGSKSVLRDAGVIQYYGGLERPKIEFQ